MHIVMHKTLNPVDHVSAVLVTSRSTPWPLTECQAAGVKTRAGLSMAARAMLPAEAVDEAPLAFTRGRMLQLHTVLSAPRVGVPSMGGLMRAGTWWITCVCPSSGCCERFDLGRPNEDWFLVDCLRVPKQQVL